MLWALEISLLLWGRLGVMKGWLIFGWWARSCHQSHLGSVYTVLPISIRVIRRDVLKSGFFWLSEQPGQKLRSLCRFNSSKSGLQYETVIYASYIFVSASQASTSSTREELALCPLPWHIAKGKKINWWIKVVRWKAARIIVYTFEKPRLDVGKCKEQNLDYMREKKTHNKILAPKQKYLKGTSFSTDYRKEVGQKGTTKRA